MRRYDLTEAQWQLLTPYLPTNGPKGGRPWNDHRRTINGILWILHTGAPWRDLPEGYGKWQSVYDRFNWWRKNKIWDRILKALQIRLDRQGRIDWDVWMVDGTSVRASRAAAGGGKRGDRKNPWITVWAARAADSARNSTWLLTERESRSDRQSLRHKSTTRSSSRTR